MFGSIPPRFEEGYETDVNVCCLLIHFDSFGICLKEMSDDVEELKRRLEEQIGAMIHFPSGPVYRSKEKYSSQIFVCRNLCTYCMRMFFSSLR
jgi:hypothetical protein